ncbi:MAG: iron-containing alcohol dehydrogenase [Alphaproteobacteria bacterium]|nr:iron-containing alcohol dehydrogenase [Alphaproteobacteria bacterium]
MTATILMPRIMTIGAGASLEAAAVLARLGLSRPLVVTDPYLRQSGMLDRFTAGLDAAGVVWGLFAEVVPDPTTQSIAAGLAALRGKDYDCLLAFGGGSPIDTAKAMAVLASQGGRMRDHKVPAVVDRPALPLIAVPTTAGTGSEVTRFTVVTDTETSEKMLCVGTAFLPAAALVDYELTLTMPARLTADTGIDSLTHAIESYVGRRANPFSDAMALRAMTLIAAHVRTACRQPDDRPAREAMMLGATLAGIAFSNASLALVHGLSRPIGAFFHVPHGLSNAMLLPTVTAFSAPAALGRYADCARAMGVAAPGAGDEAAVAALLDELRRLNADLDVPTPSAWGIAADDWFGKIETMADQAIASGSPANNPRVPTRDEILSLYRAVWDS